MNLELFRQIVLTRSLAEASDRIGLSAPAASPLLSLLEAEIRLFSRDKRQLSLTDRFELRTMEQASGQNRAEL